MAIGKTAAKKKTSTALVPWQERFAPYAQQAKEQVAKVGGGVGVKFGRGKITVGGVDAPGGKLECIILGSCAMNAWYEADYDPNEVTTPNCYAFADAVGDPEMAPHADAPDKQSDLCADCEKNQFGTAKVGRGKACGNLVRLGLLLASDAEEAADIATAAMATAKVSATNVKNWAGFIKSLQELEDGPRPPWGVVTEISAHDDTKNQIRVEFKLVELIDDSDILNALEKRLNGLQEELQRPFQIIEAAPAAKGAKGRQAAPAAGKSKKFAARGR